MPDQQQIDAAQEITVTLQAQEWNIVLETLQDGRYRLVGPVIQKMMEQFEQMQQGQQERPRPHLQPAS